MERGEKARTRTPRPSAAHDEVLDCVHATPHGCGIRVLVQPKARKPGVLGVVGDRIKIGVKAAPEDGKANRELLKFLGRLLDVPSGALRIAVGETSRRKEIAVSGLAPDAVVRRIVAGD